MKHARIAAGVLAWAVAGSALAAECAPPKLIRIVTQNVSPGLPSGSFAALPKVMYRIGNDRIRTEEQHEPEENIQMLFVTHQPDSWVIDLIGKKGQHVIDPGPSLLVHAPIFYDESLPKEIIDVEYGCEAAFIAAKETTHERREGTSGSGTKHWQKFGAWRISLFVPDGRITPMLATLLKDEKVVSAIRYRSFQELDSVPDGLFAPPPGITMNPAPATK